MSMDLTAAKGVLQRVADQYKAARELGEALDAMVDLERQQNTLTNNVDNLQKEQARLTAEQAAMRQAAKDEAARIQKEHAVKVAALQAAREASAKQIQQNKDEAAQSLLEQMATATAAIQQEEARLRDMQGQRMALEQAVSSLGRQLDEMKAKMRQFVS